MPRDYCKRVCKARHINYFATALRLLNPKKIRQ
nr:MAG TPA: hypothetical protein [Inoviridae sp.]